MNEVIDWPELAIFVQLNDFYHIDYAADPVNNSSRILPRVTTILRRLRREFEPHRVHFSLPGDFLNPSCLSRAHRGRQMIDLLNLLELRMAVFGNHEFDFDPQHYTVEDLLKRIKQSKFPWLASNLLPAPEHEQFFKEGKITDAITIKISPQHTIFVFGLLYESMYNGWSFGDPIGRCRGLIQQTKNLYIDEDGVYTPARATFVALTHQILADDIALANAVPDLRLIMGGHDHEVLQKVGAGDKETLIVKTKSNARTLRLNLIAWIPKDRVERLMDQFGSMAAAHTEHLAPGIVIPFVNVALTGHVEVPPSINQSDPELVSFIETVHGSTAPDRPGVYLHSYNDDGAVVIVSIVLDTLHPGFQKLVEPDGETSRRIDRWLRNSPEHQKVLLHAPRALEANDDASRSRSTNFGNFVADLISGRVKHRNVNRAQADIGFVNGGSFRLGRDIAEREAVTRGVLCDLLFHENDIRFYRLPGSAIAQIVDRCYRSFRGQGDFLQVSGLAVVEDGVKCLIVDPTGNEQPLDPARVYSVATTSYVAMKAYRDIFAAFEPATVVEQSVREALEQEIAAQAPNLVISDQARWRLAPR